MQNNPAYPFPLTSINNTRPGRGSVLLSQCSNCKSFTDLLQLPCSHFCCQMCISNFLEIALESASVKQLACTVCSAPIPGKLFRDVVAEDSYAEYLQRAVAKEKNRPGQQNCGLCGENHGFRQGCMEKVAVVKEQQFCQQRVNGAMCRSIAECVLGCQHCFCKECLQRFIRGLLEKDPFNDSMGCPTCGVIMQMQIIYQAFGDVNRYINIKEAQVDNLLAPSRKCEICYSMAKVSEMLTLDCDDRFCKTCLQDYIRCNLTVTDIQHISCPKCKKLIDVNIILQNLSEEDKNKYLNISLKSYKSEEQNLIMKWCKDCEFGALIDKYATSFECPNCHQVYCPRCNMKHPYVEKCPERKISTGFGQDSIFMKELLKNTVYCPNCDGAIQKDGGCNFIECKYPRCETSFCIICRKKLTVRYK
jgi:predicted RNA-binding Zn-ribbon protein involved in translation (DUF1610 family)